MKNFVITGLTALTLGMVALSAAHAADTMTVDQKLEAFREGKPGVYGRSPVTDIGNVIASKGGAEEQVNCADMPCCKNMKMDMQGCEKMMGKGK